MKKRIRFIINPHSGVHKNQSIRDLITHEIDATAFEYDIKETEYAGHATELAQEAATEGYDVVVAVGGDGSVNEVAAGLIGSKTVLGMLPAGSGNGFAMHLGWGRDVAAVIRQLSEADIKKVDTCAMNGRLFVNLAGIGFEATVAHQIRGAKRRGFQAYFRSSFDNLFNYKFKKYNIRVDDKLLETEALNVTVANAPMYGYNFVVAPLAKLNDGKLEVVVVQKAAWWRYLTDMPRFLNNTLHESSLVKRLSGQRVEIGLSEPDYAQYDGEGIEVNNNKIVFTINPLSLNVLVPHKRA
jgi:YegS/Rv2252/BmrU family lipid kinase